MGMVERHIDDVLTDGLETSYCFKSKKAVMATLLLCILCMVT